MLIHTSIYTHILFYTFHLFNFRRETQIICLLEIALFMQLEVFSYTAYKVNIKPHSKLYWWLLGNAILPILLLVLDYIISYLGSFDIHLSYG